MPERSLPKRASRAATAALRARDPERASTRGPGPSEGMGTGLTDSPSRPSMDSAARKDATQRPAHASALQAQLRACGDAQRWDEAAALRWFEAHRLGLRERQARAGVNGAATIAVGLGVRWHETPSSAKLTREQAGTAR